MFLLVSYTHNSLKIYFISGPVADKIGRKDTLMLHIIPYGAGWLMICYATSIAQIIIGRFICGFAIGIINMAGALYCVEISTPEVRGIVGAACQGFLVVGNLLSVSLGSVLSWRLLALNGVCFAIFTTICFFPMPETPRWLLAKGRVQEAIRVMDDLQGGYVDAVKECNNIYKDLKDEPKGSLTFEELKNPAVYKPAIIGMWLTFFLEFSGANAIFLYSTDIFEAAGGAMKPKQATIVLGAVQVVVTLFANSLTDRAGRRILLIISGTLMCLSLAAMGIFYYFSKYDTVFKSNYSWLPLVSLVTCVIGYSIGYGPIPRLIVAEMVPTRARSSINSMVNIINGISGFIIIKTFPEFEELLTTYGTFWLYSCINAVGVLYVFFMVPETKGKELEEIEKIFKKPKSNAREISISVIS